MEVAPLFIFVLGLLIGSFLNVCIYRIPRGGLSINFPRWSFCPECQATIRFYDNIPVLSYILLLSTWRNGWQFSRFLSPSFYSMRRSSS